jgi:hypothetical protein
MFWAFLGKGSSKTPYKYFCKKSMSKTFPKKIDRNFDVCFTAFSGVSQRRDFKNTTKTFGGKSMSKKKSQKKLRICFPVVFPPIFFIAFLAVSLHEEQKSTIQIFSRIRPQKKLKKR